MTVDTKTQEVWTFATPDAGAVSGSVQGIPLYDNNIIIITLMPLCTKTSCLACIYVCTQLNLPNVKVNPLPKVVTVNSLDNYKPSKVYTHIVCSFN